MGKPKPRADAANTVIGIILALLLAITLLPAVGLQRAYADEPVERPVTSGGDVALENANGAAEAQAPIAQAREDGMVVADGLVYTVADGGLALVGFDFTEGAGSKSIYVPAVVSVDGKEASVVAIGIADGQVAENAVVLTIPQTIKSINVDSLAPAFPSLLSVEVVSAQGSTLPAAAGAAALRATYSSFGGSLLGQATVEVEGDGGSVETVQCRELLWAPPAAVAVRLPVDCLSVAPGAFADAKNLETIVCFGDVQRIAAAERDEAGNVTAEGALTDGQLETVTVVFPDATPAVPSDADGRVSASMALNDGATQTDKRRAWITLGLPLERLSMGKPTGALTETVAVGDDGAIGKTDLELISYPGMHPRATDVKHPGEDGNIDMAESGLAFTMKSDMTLSVRWEGDITATPTHLEIPAHVAIDNVTYPVTEIAPNAFNGAAFLTSVAIPESVIAIGDFAFANCTSLINTDPWVLGEALTEHAYRSGDIAGNANHPSYAVDRSELNGVDDAEQEGLPADEGTHSGDSSDSVALSSMPDIAPFSAISDRQTHVMIQNPSMRLTACNLTTDAYLTVTRNRGAWRVTVASGYYIQLWNTGANSTLYLTLFKSSDSSWVADYPLTFTPQSGYTVTGYVFHSEYEQESSTYSLSNSFGNSLTMDGRAIATVWPILSVDASDKADADHKHAAADITSGTFGSTRIADGAIATAKLAANAVTSAKIADGTVAAADLASNAVTSAKIQDGAVAAADLAANAVETAKIRDGAVTSAKIADGTIATADLANSSVTDDKLATKFGTISYSGLDGADMSVYPTSYRQGGTPALPAPKRAGSEFLGWTWAGQSEPTTDAATIKGAFAGSGDVALTANWRAASTGYFFSTEAPFSKDGGEQSFTLAVRLSDSAGTLSSASFENDNGALFPDGAGVSFAIGNALGSDGTLASAQMTASGFSSASGSPVALAQLGEQSYGVYVKVTVPGDAAGEVTKSFSDGSYVARFVKLSYELS